LSFRQRHGRERHRLRHQRGSLGGKYLELLSEIAPGLKRAIEALFAGPDPIQPLQLLRLVVYPKQAFSKRAEEDLVVLFFDDGGNVESR
jgi:hypothetical protein